MFHCNYLTIVKTPKSKYYYVGKHSTSKLDDGYYGSGVIIKKICKRYPHKTRILEVFNSEVGAYQAEEILVSKAKNKYGKHSLNIADGGVGKIKGTKLSALTKRKMSEARKDVKWSEARRAAETNVITNKGLNHYSNRIGFSLTHREKLGVASKRRKGFKHSDSSRSNMSKSKIGDKNPMFGKVGAMRGKPAVNRNASWEFYDELKVIWLNSGSPSAFIFKKIAIDMGYPSCSYRGIIEKWQA